MYVPSQYEMVLQRNVVFHHYNDVTMSEMAFFQAQIKENIKAPRHWALCRVFHYRWFPRTKGQEREIFLIWWRHHVAWENAQNDPWYTEETRIVS